MKKIFSFIYGQEGVAAVEFALLAPALLTLLLGIVDFGTYMNTMMKMENISRAAAEYVRQGGDPDNLTTDVVTATAFDLTPEEMASISFDSDYTCECNNGQPIECAGESCGDNNYMRRYLEIDMTMQYDPLFSFPGLPEKTSLQSFVRVQMN